MAALAYISVQTAAPTLVTPVGFSASEPQVALSGKRVFVTYGAGDQLYMSRSDDGGKSYAPPSKLPTSGSLALGMRRGPRIAATGQNVVVTAIYGKSGGGQDGDLLSWRSNDAGRTWTGPVAVNDVPAAAREGLHGMASSGEGKIACVWLDLREKGTQVWESTSRDGGATWSKNIRVYRSPDGTVCECCHPSVAFGPKGQMYVMFRNWLGGARDMYLAASTNSGRSFSPAQKLGRGTWPLNACPMDGGAVAVAADGTVTTVWRREGRVYVARPGAPETDLGEGTQPWIAMGKDGLTAVWQTRGRLQGWAAGNTLADFGQGRDAAVASTAAGAIVVWADSAGRIWSLTL